MAGNSGAIKAGRAYVEIYADKNPLVRALDSAKSTVAAWGSSIAKVGIGVGAAGIAITAPFIAAAKSFSDFGSALADASARTGASVESLSVLKYAAEQTGSSFEAIESGFKGLAKSGKFAGMSADDAFRKGLETVAAIEDPLERSRVAMDIFGKSGMQLIPLATQFGELERAAKGMGLVMSTEAAASADALGDAWGDLIAVGTAMVNTIGESLAPVLTESIELITDFASVIAKGGILEAGKLVWQGLSALWAEGIAYVAMTTKEGFKAAASYLIDVFSTIQTAWVEVTEFMSTQWNKATGVIADRIIEIMGWFDKSLDVADAQGNRDEDTRARQAEFDKRRQSRLAEIESTAERWKTTAGEGIDGFAQSAAEAALAEMGKFQKQIDSVRNERKGGKGNVEKLAKGVESIGDIEGKTSTVGTFSGALAGGLGAGNRLDEIAAASKLTAQNTGKLARGKGGIPVTT